VNSIGLPSRERLYPTGRSNDWVTKTCQQRETLPVAGLALDGNKWDGLYVGRRKGFRRPREDL
jgi:bifunctional non-homologous end joining protein LigD